MLRSVVFCALLAACQGEISPPSSDMVEPALPTVVAQEVAAPRMLVGASAAEIEAGGATSFSIEGTRALTIVLKFPVAPPSGTPIRLDIVNELGVVYAAYTHPVDGHEVDFVLPIAGSRIQRLELSGSYTLVATIGESGEIVTQTINLEGVTP